jgi:hypothetical protein
MPDPTDNPALLERILPLSRFLAGSSKAVRRSASGAARRACTTPLARRPCARLPGRRGGRRGGAAPRPAPPARPVMARLVARDLAGLADLAEVTETMTVLADVAVTMPPPCCRPRWPRATARRARRGRGAGAGRRRHGQAGRARAQRLLGHRPDLRLPGGRRDRRRRARLSNFEFFTKLGRQLIGALAEITGDGQVFRVDMRLRPNGDSGPLVASFDMLENYFVTQGREWERYAWIKARPMRGARGAELGRRPALRLPQVPRLRRHQRHARPARADPPRGGAPRHGRQHQARPRRHPRDRVHRPGLPAHPRRPRQGAAGPPDAQGAGSSSPSAASSTRPPCASWPPPTASCAGWSTACNTSTTRRPTPCRKARPTRRSSPAAWASAILRRPARGTRRPPRQRQPAFRGRLRRPQPPGPRPRRRLARLRPRRKPAGSGAGARPPRLRRRGEPRAAPGRHPQRQPLPADAGRHPRALRRAGAAPDRGGGETPNPDATLARGLDLLEAISRRAAYLALLQQYPQALQKVAQLVGASSWAASI